MKILSEPRAHRFEAKFSDEEIDRLRRLAKHYGLGAAALIRMLLKKEDDALPARIV